MEAGRWGNASGAGEWPGRWAGAARAWAALALGLILLLSALGTGGLLALLGRRRELRTVPNALVLSLALAELLGALLGLPPALAALLRQSPPAASAWLLGRRLCLASAALHAALGVAASLSLALLAFERYCALARQPRRALGRRRAAQLLAAAWLAALAAAVPCALLPPPQPHHGAPYWRCWHAPPWAASPAGLGAPYGAALLLLGYLLPFALMCFCHYNLCRALRRAESRVRPLAPHSPPQSHRHRRGEMRTATTVLLLIFALACCWGPYCLLGLATATTRLSFSPTTDALASWAAWANGAINPLIYAARNPNLAPLFARRGGYQMPSQLDTYPERRTRAKSRAERYASHGHGATGTLHSSSPASGGEAATWACKNPALLFCRDGQPDILSEVGARLKADTVDTSL